MAEIEAMNRGLRIIVLDDGKTYPITNWFDNSGNYVLVKGTAGTDVLYGTRLKDYEKSVEKARLFISER